MTTQQAQIELKDYQKMIVLHARRAQASLGRIGINIDLDEVVQEGCAIFVKAMEGYDETRQVKFSTYLWTALQRNLNRFCDKQRDARTLDGPALTDTIGDEDGGTLMDVVADINAPDAAQLLESRQEAFENLRSFTPEARRVLVQLIRPTEHLLKEIGRMQAFAKHAKGGGFGSARHQFSVDTIMTVLGYDDRLKSAVRREIKKFMERT